MITINSISARVTLCIFFQFLFTGNLIGQKAKSRWKSHSSYDTLIHFIALNTPENGKKIAIFETGQNASVVVSQDTVLTLAAEKYSSESTNRSYHKWKSHFKKDAKKSDTAYLSESFDFPVKKLISDLIEKGKASVYCKKEKAFVDSISYKVEKHYGVSTINFYLPDGSLLFKTIISVRIDPIVFIDAQPDSLDSVREVEKNRHEISMYDTSTHFTSLKAWNKSSKVATIENSEEVLIIADWETLRDRIQQTHSQHLEDSSLSEMLTCLSPVAKGSDTINLSVKYNFYRKKIISDLLIEGNARVYDKKQHAFVDSISYKNKRHILEIVRHYYLPDGRCFFDHVILWESLMPFEIE